MTRKSRTQTKLVNEKKIEKLAELMKKNKLDIIQVETEGEKICLARNVGSLGFIQQKNQFQQQYSSPIPPEAAGSSTAAVPTDLPVQDTTSTSQIPDGHTLTCPFVGTFYRSPSPEAAPYVDIGSQVKKGQTLCIVEAMKLMNEIESDIDGKVVAVLADNGKPVEFGTPLFVIAPN